MRVDEDIVAADIGVIRGNVADAAHVGREVIHFVDASPRGQKTIVGLAQIEDLEFVRGARLVFRILDIHPAHPIAVSL